MRQVYVVRPTLCTLQRSHVGYEGGNVAIPEPHVAIDKSARNFSSLMVKSGMAKFEYKTTSGMLPPSTIEADDYNLDTKGGKLTFFDKDNNQLASFSIGTGAYVKRLGN